MRKVTGQQQKYGGKSGTLLVSQRVCIQISTDILYVLMWVQTVCEGNQQKRQKAQLARKEFQIPRKYMLITAVRQVQDNRLAAVLKTIFHQCAISYDILVASLTLMALF